METLSLSYGDKVEEITIEGAKSVVFLREKQVCEITDLHEYFLHAVTDGAVASPPLCDLVDKNDLVTLVVSDITRFWTRQDLVCEQLVNYLNETIGLPFENIVILIALGTHRPMTDAELEKIVSPAVYKKVRVCNHDSMATDLVYVGSTTRGTRVIVNPLAVGRKVILIGGTVHHLMSGFGGGRKSILPGICAKSTIVQNHLHCLSPDEPRSNTLIGIGKLENNPVHEDMTEAASLVSPVFGINIIAGAHGIVKLVCGNWQKAWEESCRFAEEYFGVGIDYEADIVIASCGGYPKDINLYQSVKTLLNAGQAVREGGTMILLAECREGGGAPDFFDWINPLRRGTLDADLRADFSISGYIFYASCEALARCNALMLSEIPSETVEAMKICAFSDIKALLNEVDFTDKDVYVMPFGGGTVPHLK